MKYYTTEEVASILSLDNETIRRYLQSKKIKGYKVGKVWRVEESDLSEFIKSGVNKEE